MGLLAINGNLYVNVGAGYHVFVATLDEWKQLDGQQHVALLLFRGYGRTH